MNDSKRAQAIQAAAATDPAWWTARRARQEAMQARINERIRCGHLPRQSRECSISSVGRTVEMTEHAQPLSRVVRSFGRPRLHNTVFAGACR
jgi:hypothetical protein